jgi:hypothetical protein
MKKYIAPQLNRTAFRTQDVITASPLWDYLQENGYQDSTRSFDFNDVAPEENGG